MKEISNFFGEYRFLSNFWYAPVEFEGVTYPTNEHAYQAAKTVDPKERQSVANAKSPGDAKRAGRKITLRSDWEKVKIDVMHSLVKKKFKHRGLRRQLLDTGDAHLVEGNNWNDTFWGVCKGKGRNELGKILMNVREYYRSLNQIEYRTGSLFEAPEHVLLAHSCNAQGVWGSGIAAQFKRLFPESFEEYEQKCLSQDKKRDLVGQAIVSGRVVCLITSCRYGKDVDSPKEILRATKEAIKDLLDKVEDGTEVHSPKINSGLFNTPWEETAKCIEQILEGHEKDIKWTVWERQEDKNEE